MIGCLVIHGFSGTRTEVADICEHLQKKNWLVYCPELPGHDGTRESMKSVTYKHWIFKSKVALEELLTRCDKVYVIGFSMGGVIASYLASQFPVEKLVLLSSAVYYINPKQLAQDIKGWVLERIRGELDQDELYHFYRQKVKQIPMSATLEFAKMVRKLRNHLDDITSPTLIIHGENDGLVPEKSAQYIYDHIQSADKRLYFFPDAKHHVWFGEQKQELLDIIDSFFDEKMEMEETS